MDTAADRLAARFLAGAHREVVAALSAVSPELAGTTAERIGSALRHDAAANWNVFPRERTWVHHQRALLELARLPGVDQAALAAALTEAISLQRISGWGSPLDPDVFAWMLRCVPAQVHAAANDQWRNGHRFLRSALWSLPGADSRAWMLQLWQADPDGAAIIFSARGLYEDMRRGYMRAVWDDEEWNARVHLLCDARFARAPLYIDEHLPAAASAAQVRFACTYATAASDWLVRIVAANLRRYRTGDPLADVALVWWDVPDEQIDVLRTLLELAGAAGARDALVDAAHATGAIDAERTALLRAPIPRPAWMDGEVPWEIDQQIAAGEVHLPDGRFAAADPYWAFEGVAFEAQVPPGRYPVTLTTATHPLHGRAFAVADLSIDPETSPRHWERIGRRPDPPEFGYGVQVGVGSFGAVDALTRAEIHDLAPDDLLGAEAGHAEIDAGELGSIAMFTVRMNHQICRTWIGRSPTGEIVRCVSDLGILHIDPETNPHEPLKPGPPPTKPTFELPLTETERDTGIARNRRYRALDQPADTVTVLEIRDAEHSWLGVPSVWYRRDSDRAGELLPVDEFNRRHSPI